MCGDDEEDSIRFISGTIEVSVEKLRKLATFFKRSSLNNEKLQSYVISRCNERTETPIEKPLKLDCKTRWSSLYIMISRYWEIKDSVQHTLLDINSDIIITNRDKYIYFCILNTLRPVMMAVKVLLKKYIS